MMTANMDMRLTAVVEQEGQLFTAWCPDLDVASQGNTIDEALKSLEEAVELFLEDDDAELTLKRPFLTTIEVDTNGKTPSGIGA